VETLRLDHGSCRDFAMLMIEAARSLGFAGRFASGYLAVPLHDPTELTSGSAHGSTHAWAQIYFSGTGWIDFDPFETARAAHSQFAIVRRILCAKSPGEI
jgi:transglutaminase-like putative cysteine protease